MDVTQLQAQVERLQSDLRDKDADLRLATSALLAIHNGAKLQDVVEVNVALEEQVKSLKKMVMMLQQAADSASKSQRPVSGDPSGPRKVDSGREAELFELVLGDGMRDDHTHVRHNVSAFAFMLGWRQRLRQSVV